MPFTEPFAKEEQARLLDLARHTLTAGVAEGHRPAPPDLEAFVHREPAACFVTLKLEGALRGCIGTLEAQDPLPLAVAKFAYSAGFEDPRFPPLAALELETVRIEISVLSPLEPLAVEDEAALLAALEPGVDGLWLDARAHRATFLPQVWEQLPEPAQFVAQLKRKAGLAADAWPADAYWYRYRVTAFAEP